MQNLGIVIGLAAIAFGLCSVAAAIRYVGNRIKVISDNIAKFVVKYDLHEEIKNKELLKECAEELAKEGTKENSIQIKDIIDE